MRERPDLPDEKLISCLRDNYGLQSVHIAFLPLGNDVNTAVYQVVADDATPYFLKLRSGAFDETTALVPRFLKGCGITRIIAPIETRTRELWSRLDDFTVMLFPFVVGQNGFARPLSDRQWVEFGAVLKGIHMAVLPPSLRRRIPREMYSPYWRDLVRAFQARGAHTAFADPVAAQLAAFLRVRRDEIARIVGRAESLGNALRARSLEYVPCHADIHAGNLLIGSDDTLYIVDWDTLIVAPKERDLMFIGGGVGGVWHGAREEALFSEGYGEMERDPMALAYYRYERIVQDIAAYCEQLFLTDEGGADRAAGLRHLLDQFLPDNVVAIADATDALLRAK